MPRINRANLVTFVLIFIIITLGALMLGWIEFDLAGILAGLVFFAFLAFIGYLIDKSGLGKYFGGKA